MSSIKKMLLITAAYMLMVFISACSNRNNTNDGQNIVGNPSGNFVYLDEEHLQTFKELQKDTSTNNMEIRELLYVSIYSDIYIRNKEMRLPLTSTLNVRNVSVDKPIYVSAIDFYDSDGRLIKKYLDKTIKINALQSIWLVVGGEQAGGTGANFIVDWGGEENSPKPIVEALMTGSAYQLGLSFKTESVVSKIWKSGEEIAVPLER